MKELYEAAGAASGKYPRSIKAYAERFHYVHHLQKKLRDDGFDETVRVLANIVRDSDHVRTVKARPNRPGAFKRPDKAFRRERQRVIRAKAFCPSPEVA